MASLVHDTGDRESLTHKIDEYFRKNFRKVSFEDARDIVIAIGFDPEVTPKNTQKIE